MVDYGQPIRDEVVSLSFNPFQLPPDTLANPPDHEATQARVAFESRIRAAYVRAMRRWINENNPGADSTWGADHNPKYDGGIAPNGRNYRSSWVSIADFLAEHNCFDAEGFIDANCIPGARPPEPAQLITQTAIDTYRSRAANTPKALQSALTSQAGVFRVENLKLRRWYPDTAKQEIWRRVLLTLDVQISPLFCYCLAAREGFSDICQLYEELAISQYMTNPAAYRQAWAAVLPDTLIQHCDALLAEINGGRQG